MAAKWEVERAEFETITRHLIPRAAAGRGRVAAVGREDAEDVVQSAWEKVVRQDKPLRRGGSLEAHVHEALVDVSADHRRTRGRKSAVPSGRIVPLDAVSEDAVGLLHPHDETDAALAARELYETIVDVVGKEAATYAVLNALSFSEKESAAELGISEREAGALRKRVARSRSAIAKAISSRLTNTEEEH